MVIDSVARDLEGKIASGTATVAVVGLGYVGLPLALNLVRGGYSVIGLDIDREKVKALQAGRSYLRDVPAGELQASLATDRLAATSDPSALPEADAVFICVPAPFTVPKEPDTTYIARAAEDIAAHGREGQLVILRSTSYPGTTQEVVPPILERRGRPVGIDIFLAFAPERIDTGNAPLPADQIPIVVASSLTDSSCLSMFLLRRLTRRVVPVSSPAA